MDPEREATELLRAVLEGAADCDTCCGTAEDLGVTSRTRLSTFEEMGSIEQAASLEPDDERRVGGILSELTD